MFPSSRLLIFPLNKIIHSFFPQGLLKPLLCDRLPDVKERELNQESRGLAFIPSCVTLGNSLSSEATGPTASQWRWDRMFWHVLLSLNHPQIYISRGNSQSRWPTVSFAKSSKAVRRLLEGGMARPRWLIKHRKLL